MRYSSLIISLLVIMVVLLVAMVVVLAGGSGCFTVNGTDWNSASGDAFTIYLGSCF